MPILKNRSSEVINWGLALAAVALLGLGTATAAISVAPAAESNPALRPLTIGRSLQVQPAFGPDDEDCVFATHKLVQPNGRVRIDRTLECAE